MTETCECKCCGGCQSPATTTVEGIPHCAECAEYVNDEFGQPVCSRCPEYSAMDSEDSLSKGFR